MQCIAKSQAPKEQHKAHSSFSFICAFMWSGSQLFRNAGKFIAIVLVPIVIINCYYCYYWMMFPSLENGSFLASDKSNAFLSMHHMTSLSGSVVFTQLCSAGVLLDIYHSFQCQSPMICLCPRDYLKTWGEINAKFVFKMKEKNQTKQNQHNNNNKTIRMQQYFYSSLAYSLVNFWYIDIGAYM